MLGWSGTNPDGKEVETVSERKLLALLQRDRHGHVAPLRVANVVPETSQTEAMEYLAAWRKVAPDLASKIIAFCGTRIQLLKTTNDRLDEGIDLNGLFTPLAAACVLL